MRNPKFESIRPNYRKGVLEIVLKEGRRSSRYSLPFGVLRGVKIGVRNRVRTIVFDPELGGQGATLTLEDGTQTDFPADFVLYCCDPTYDWAPLNQLKRALKDKVAASRLSIRVLADALGTSPSQVVRLLEDNRGSKQLMQLFQLAGLTGYRIEFQLLKIRAA